MQTSLNVDIPNAIITQSKLGLYRVFRTNCVPACYFLTYSEYVMFDDLLENVISVINALDLTHIYSLTLFYCRTFTIGLNTL